MSDRFVLVEVAIASWLVGALMALVLSAVLDRWLDRDTDDWVNRRGKYARRDS